jgi:hypothetical protein
VNFTPSGYFFEHPNDDPNGIKYQTTCLSTLLNFEVDKDVVGPDNGLNNPNEDPNGN